jgi:hypothetical protein
VVPESPVVTAAGSIPRAAVEWRQPALAAHTHSTDETHNSARVAIIT